MERHHRSTLTLFAEGPFAVGAEIPLDPDASHHAQVRRTRDGEAIRLVDGAGSVAAGTLVVRGKRAAAEVHDVTRVPPPSPLELLVPVADRDRMLLAAEKAVELQVTAWRPVVFARSRSVTHRGEGERFREKVAARMRSALEQSGGGWLPVIHEETVAETAFRDADGAARRFILDEAGGPLLAHDFSPAPVTIAAGPEGGFEPTELELAGGAGWMSASLGRTTLRFETALIAAAAVIRAAQLTHGRS